MIDTTTVYEGLYFAESPSQGPDGYIYVSDFYARKVIRFNPVSWKAQVVARINAQPSGLGWLPDGRLLVVSMRDLKLMRLERDGSLQIHADLASVARGAANDMMVDAQGRAWVGSFGFDFYGMLENNPSADPLFGPGANPPTADLARVDIDGTVSLAAEGLQFPNGTVQLQDGTLLIAETVGSRLTSFTIDEHGKLRDRCIWADLSKLGPDGDRVLPDGICVDDEDGVWVSDPVHNRAIKVTRGGVVTRSIRTSQPCFAVGLLKSNQLNALVCATAATSNPNVAARQRTGRLEIAAL